MPIPAAISPPDAKGKQKTIVYMQCCGFIMIYSGSGSSFEFSEFRIQAKVPDPIRIQPILIKCPYLELIQKHTLNSIKKKNLDNYLPFSISYYSPTAQTVQNS